jgi:hypothetical protein
MAVTPAPETILGLPAGPALNALVAERAMGWGDCDPDEWRGACRPAGTVGGVRLAIPPYSQDLGAAWHVADAMWAKGFLTRVETGSDFLPARPVFVVSMNAYERGRARQSIAEVTEGPRVSARADTLPLAICRAALLRL